MANDIELMTLTQSMKQTLKIENLSSVKEVGEVFLDCIFEDSILKDIPIIGTIVGATKCIKNIHDILFTKKLLAFLNGICDCDSHERQTAIEKWESYPHYRINVGETLLAMINRCDDSQKAAWLSKLFYELVLLRQKPTLFMRAEKVLSSLSVMDVFSFLSYQESFVKELSLEEGEPFANSGLYRIKPPKEEVMVEVFHIKSTKLLITEIGKWIYFILNDKVNEMKI